MVDAAIIMIVVLVVIGLPLGYYLYTSSSKPAYVPPPTAPPAAANTAPPPPVDDVCKGYLVSAPKPECLTKMWTGAGCAAPYNEAWGYYGKDAKISKTEMEKLAKSTECWTLGTAKLLKWSDAGYYEMNPDAKAAATKPIEHWCKPGNESLTIKTNTGETGLFSKNKYNELHPDVLAAKIDARTHFCNSGYNEGRIIGVE
jgi:hypothetical protein